MYHIYDYEGYYLGDTSKLSWAKKIANDYDGYVEDEYGLVYDALDYSPFDDPYAWCY